MFKVIAWNRVEMEGQTITDYVDAESIEDAIVMFHKVHEERFFEIENIIEEW